MPRPRRDLTTPEKRHLHSLEGRMARLEAELQATRREWPNWSRRQARPPWHESYAYPARRLRIACGASERTARGGAVGGEGRKGSLAFSRGRVYVPFRYGSGASRFSHQRSEPTYGHAS